MPGVRDDTGSFMVVCMNNRPDQGLTLEAFRALFPEFEESEAYPDALLNARIEIANLRINEERWRNLSDYGRALMVAHYTALWKRNQLETTRIDAQGNRVITQAPGLNNGTIASKSVGSVSVSYDTHVSLLDDAGFWNLTLYGQEFWQLVTLIGMPGLQL